MVAVVEPPVAEVKVETKETAPDVVAEQRPARREPADLFAQLQEEMNRLWGAWPFGGTLRRRGTTSTAFVPRTDVFERNGTFVVKAELPGLEKDEVAVTVEDGDLVMRAEHKAEQEVKDEDYYHMERTVGAVYRRIPLPEGVDIDQIRATLDKGVLEVTFPLPTKRAAEPVKVAIH